jgi:RHS repeat-associated protein
VIVYTRFTYDANNRRTTQTRPEGERTTYFYNEINQVRSVVYGGGHQVEYRYNGLGLPDTVKYYGPSASNLADKTVRYDYDVNGNLLSYTDGTTSADYLYDDLHRKISETVHYPHFSKTYTVDFPDNWHIDFTGPDGVTVTSSYDAGMRLSEISVPGAGSFDFTNYDWARPQTITLPTNTTIHKSYDALMRTTGILVQDSAATQLMSRTLSYDKVGNLLAKQTEHGLYSYSYDELNRLTDALNPGLPDEHFTYDPLGNRLTDNGVSGPLSYNRNNELTSLGGVTLSYDDNGNMVANNWPGIEQRYVYDETKRLKQIKDPTGAVTAEYYYDPFGRRLWKEVDGARTYFMYSGEGLIAEFDDNGSQIRGYGYAMGSTWTTNPLWLKEGGDYYFYLNDHLGTPQKIIDAAGEVVWAARYDSFGNAIIDIETITNPLRFPGQYYDEESGLHYNWNRYYDPFLGRYIQSDPLGLDAGINFFVYANNRPLTVIDPWGLEPGDFYDGSGYGKYGEEDTGQGYQSGGYADSPGYGEGLQSGWQYRLNPRLAEKNPSGPLAVSPVAGGHEGKSAQQIAWEKLTPEEQRSVRAHRNAQRAAQRAAAKRAAQGGGGTFEEAVEEERRKDPDPLPGFRKSRPENYVEVRNCHPNTEPTQPVSGDDINYYGFTGDVFEGWGMGIDFGLIENPATGQWGAYAAAEVGYGSDVGGGVEVGRSDSIDAMKGSYAVAEVGAGGVSVNHSVSPSGQTSTSGNLGTDNALAPAGHVGTGYGVAGYFW